MAVKDYTILSDSRHKTHSIVVQWTLGNGDTGAPFDGIDYPRKCVQMSGTFGAAVTMEGCNTITSPTTYAQVSDITGTLFSMSAAGLKHVLEVPYWIRPNAGAVTSVVVTMACSMDRA